MGWFSKKESNGKKSELGAASSNPVVESIGSYTAPVAVDTIQVTNSAGASKSAPAAQPTTTVASPSQSPAKTSTAVETVPSEQQQTIDSNNDVDMAVSQDQHDIDEDDYEEIEAPASTTSYSGAADSDHSGQYASGKAVKQTHLNSLFNGHLMKWKFEAEEGTSFLRVPAFFGALALMVTAIVAVVIYPEAWEPRSIVMTACVVVMSLFILVLEGRFIAPNPVNTRAHVRNIMTRNFNILRFVWGRGILYILAGTVNVAQTWIITMVSGGVMIALGIVSIFVGVHASRKFAALRNSLADESYVLLLFSYYDSDSDGYLDVYQFTNLLSYLGMEVDDRYALKAFNAIDRNGDRRIGFDEFNHWWTSGYIERGRKGPMDFEDDGRLS